MKARTWKPGDPVGAGPVTFESEADRKAYGQAVRDEIQRQHRRAQLRRARNQRHMNYGK